MLSALLATALSLASRPPIVSEGSEEEFHSTLARTRELAALGRWKIVASELDLLLVRHERAPYVTPVAPELVELLARCAFFSEFADPDPRSLVPGELASYDPASGRIVLRCRAPWEDFQTFDDFLQHPAAFVGPHEIEVTGRVPRELAEGQSPPQILVCVGPGTSHQVVFGLPRVAQGDRETWIAPRIVRNSASESVVLAELPETPLALGERYRIAVEVGTTRITASVDGRVILSAAKPRELFGRVALRCPDVDQVVLTGFADPAWLRGLADSARVAAEQDFRRTWDPASRVPRWLLELVTDDVGARRETGIRISRALAPDGRATLARLSELQAARKPTEGLALLAALDGDALPAELGLFYACLFSCELERLDEALAAIDAAIASAPDFVEARALRVRVLALRGERSAVLSAADEVAAAAPSDVFSWSECVRGLLSIGEPLRAKAAVEEALRRGVPREALRDAESLLVRALGGPVWESVHEYRSAHYAVKSDVGRAACFEAANVLEESLRFYERRLGRLSSATRDAGGGPRARLPVYVFAGRAGFVAYASDLFPTAPESTAGLYSPLLEQLLVWSQAEKSETLRTLRHEGLHAYLDARLPRGAPRWLDEGLAEYFEAIATTRGAPADGAPHAAHLRVLTDPSVPWLPLAELFALPPDAFYADMRRHYAQSWAVVHWLLCSGLAEERIFQRMLDDLGKGASASDVHARLLSAGDLDARVRAHVATLSEPSSAGDGLSPGSR